MFAGGLSISPVPGLDTQRSFTPGSTLEAPGCQIHSRLNRSDWRSAALSLHCHVHLSDSTIQQRRSRFLTPQAFAGKDDGSDAGGHSAAAMEPLMKAFLWRPFSNS